MKHSIERAGQALQRRRDAIFAVHENHRRERQKLEQQLQDDSRSSASDGEAGKVLDALSREEEKEITEIDAALARIKAGSYGRCESCDGAIGWQRLTSLPETRYCVDCAEKNELRR